LRIQTETRQRRGRNFSGIGLVARNSSALGKSKTSYWRYRPIKIAVFAIYFIYKDNTKIYQKPYFLWRVAKWVLQVFECHRVRS
jgi:hypothetical protein